MNDVLTIVLIIVAFAFFMALVIYLIHQLVESKDEQIENLRSERDVLREELENLKSRKRFRQTRNTEAALLDMRAQLNQIKFQMEVEDDRRNYVNALLERVTQTVSEIREDPYAYDPDTPCVQKETDQYD